MSEYLMAKNYVEALINNYGVNITSSEIRAFTTGFLTGIERQELPSSPRVIKSILLNSNLENRKIIDLLVSEAIINK